MSPATHAPAPLARTSPRCLAWPGWLTRRRALAGLVASLGLLAVGHALSESEPPAPTAGQLASATLPGYGNVLATPVKGITGNLSGLTYSTATGTLFAVINRPASIAEISTDGELLRLMPLASAHDIEGIAHVRGELFAVADEAGNRVHWVQVPAHGEPRMLTQPPLWLPASTFDNLGLEGLAWDARNQRLLLAQERWPMRVVALGLDGRHQASPLDHLSLEGLDLSSVEVDPRTGHVLLLSDESAMVYEYAESGELLARLPLQAGSRGLTADVPQAEGLTLDERGNLYVVSEPNLFYRFQRQHPE